MLCLLFCFKYAPYQVEAKAKRLTDKFLESDFHQLRQAVSQVVSSRRVLAWSYVFKFYQFEDDTLERELQLFETYQVKNGEVNLYDISPENALNAVDPSTFLPIN
jgi:predicted dithiol-disulfide oxidoreductase (DUF899 family)